MTKFLSFYSLYNCWMTSDWSRNHTTKVFQYKISILSRVATNLSGVSKILRRAGAKENSRNGPRTQTNVLIGRSGKRNREAGLDEKGKGMGEEMSPSPPLPLSSISPSHLGYHGQPSERLLLCPFFPSFHFPTDTVVAASRHLLLTYSLVILTLSIYQLNSFSTHSDEHRRRVLEECRGKWDIFTINLVHKFLPYWSFWLKDLQRSCFSPFSRDNCLYKTRFTHDCIFR